MIGPVEHCPHRCGCVSESAQRIHADVDVTRRCGPAVWRHHSDRAWIVQARKAVDGGRQPRFSARVIHTRFGSIINERPEVVNGRDVRIYAIGEDCEYSWRARGSGDTDVAYADTVFPLRGHDCTEAAELAAALIPTDDEASPTVAPQRPVTMPV